MDISLQVHGGAMIRDAGIQHQAEPLASMSDATLRFELDCDSDCIHILRAAVDVMAARAGMDELHSNRAAVAVDELYANICAHAYQGEAGRVEFSADITTHEGDPILCFEFRDYAPVCWSGDLDALVAHPLDTDQLCPGGLGLRLIHSVADCCSHTALDDGNRWRLIFKLADGATHEQRA